MTTDTRRSASGGDDNWEKLAKDLFGIDLTAQQDVDDLDLGDPYTPVKGKSAEVPAAEEKSFSKQEPVEPARSTPGPSVPAEEPFLGFPEDDEEEAPPARARETARAAVEPAPVESEDVDVKALEPRGEAREEAPAGWDDSDDFGSGLIEGAKSPPSRPASRPREERPREERSREERPRAERSAEDRPRSRSGSGRSEPSEERKPRGSEGRTRDARAESPPADESETPAAPKERDAFWDALSEFNWDDSGSSEGSGGDRGRRGRGEAREERGGGGDRGRSRGGRGAEGRGREERGRRDERPASEDRPSRAERDVPPRSEEPDRPAPRRSEERPRPEREERPERSERSERPERGPRRGRRDAAAESDDTPRSEAPRDIEAPREEEPRGPRSERSRSERGRGERGERADRGERTPRGEAPRGETPRSEEPRSEGPARRPRRETREEAPADDFGLGLGDAPSDRRESSSRDAAARDEGGREGRGPRRRGRRGEAPAERIERPAPVDDFADDIEPRSTATPPAEEEEESIISSRGRGRSRREPRRPEPRVPRDLEFVEDDNAEVPVAGWANDEEDEIEPTPSYADLPTWEEAISYLVQSRPTGDSGGHRPRSDRGDRPSRGDRPRRPGGGGPRGRR